MFVPRVLHCCMFTAAGSVVEASRYSTVKKFMSKRELFPIQREQVTNNVLEIQLESILTGRK